MFGVRSSMPPITCLTSPHSSGGADVSTIITADERLAALLHNTGEIKKPPRIMVYGPQKNGQPIKVPSFPLARSYEDVVNYIGMLYSSQHDRKTAAIDSADWLEALIW